VSFLHNNVIGILEDNVGALSFARLYEIFGPGFANYLGYPYGTPSYAVSFTEPLFNAFYFLFFRLDPVLLYNLFVLGAFILAFISSFLFFKWFFERPQIALFMAALLTFSPYLYYHTRSHLALSQVWLIPPYILLLMGAKKPLHFVLLGFFLTIITAVSNYLGFFALVFTVFYFLCREMISRFAGVKYWTKNVVLGYVFMALIFVFSTGALLWSHIDANYLGQQTSGDRALGVLAERSYEDFFIYSSRPWYYFLPSAENPFFGDITQGALDYMWHDWQYFLAQKNYYVTEHSASYLGWVNFIMACLGGMWLLKRFIKKRNQAKWSKEAEVLTLGLVGFLLVLLTMPPYATISGQLIYMPSQILYHVFPMFRVLVRLGIFILLIQLIFTGFGYLQIMEWLKAKFALRFLPYLVIFPVFIFSLAEFYVPITITSISPPPKVYSYIGENVSELSPIAVYPYERTRDAPFWMSVYQQPLVNPMRYSSPKNEFYAGRFTEELVTCEGLINAQNLGVKYIVYFIGQDPNYSKNLEFFESVGGLGLVERFDDAVEDVFDSRFIRSGNFKDNSAFLYVLEETPIECY
jgi:hypothetical protein